MKRLLPPLVVLLILAVVAWRVAQDPRHERDRDWIQAHAQVGADDRVREVAEAIEQYLSDYGTRDERRWFAARAYFELGLAAHAIDTIMGVPHLAAQPDSARRLMTEYLQVAGFHDREMLHPRPGSDTVLAVLTDAGIEEAQERLMEQVRNRPLRHLQPVFFFARSQGLEPSRTLLRKNLARQEELDARLSAALLGDPPTSEELELLRTSLADEDRRRREPLFWGLEAYTLARYGTEEDADAVERLAEALRSESERRSRVSGLVAAAGLLARGRAHVHAWFEAELTTPEPSAVKDLYLEALVARVREGDEAALERIEAWWDRTRNFPSLKVRPRTLIDLYLREHLPPEGAAADRLLDLIREDANADASDRMLLAAVRLRRGDRAARDELLSFIHEISRHQKLRDDHTLQEPMGFSPLLHAARAVVLYDR